MTIPAGDGVYTTPETLDLVVTAREEYTIETTLNGEVTKLVVKVVDTDATNKLTYKETASNVALNDANQIVTLNLPAGVKLADVKLEDLVTDKNLEKTHAQKIEKKFIDKDLVSITVTPEKGADHAVTYRVRLVETPVVVYKAVTNITGVSLTGTKDNEVDLTTATVEPADATNKTIVWSLVNVGTTEVVDVATGKFTPTAAGTIKVKATIANGATESTDYTQEFEIVISE